MRFRNVSPLGDLDIDGVGHVEAGAEFDGPDGLAEQVENFLPVTSPTPPAVEAVPVEAVPVEPVAPITEEQS